jgi:hypothetical protein
MPANPRLENNQRGDSLLFQETVQIVPLLLQQEQTIQQTNRVPEQFQRGNAQRQPHFQKFRLLYDKFNFHPIHKNDIQ